MSIWDLRQLIEQNTPAWIIPAVVFFAFVYFCYYVFYRTDL